MTTYRLILSFFSIFILILLSIFIGKNYSNPYPNNEGIYFSIKPSKVNYQVGENVWIKLSLINKSESDYSYTGFGIGLAIKTLITDPSNKQGTGNFGTIDWWPVTNTLEANDTITYYHVWDYLPGGTGNYSVTCDFQNIRSNTVSFNILEPQEDERIVYEKIKEIQKKVNSNVNYWDSSHKDLEELYYNYPFSSYAPMLYNRIANGGIMNHREDYERLTADFIHNHNNSYEAYMALTFYKHYLEEIKKLNQNQIKEHFTSLINNYPSSLVSEFTVHLLSTQDSLLLLRD